MSAPIRCYRFDRLDLQPGERRVIEAGSVLLMRSPAMDVPPVPVDRAGHLVTKDDCGRPQRGVRVPANV